jgi:hypothetical protein
VTATTPWKHLRIKMMCATIRFLRGAILVMLLTAASATEASPYGDAVTASGPLAYYRLDETAGTTATNIGSASGIDATYVNVNGALNPSLIGQTGPQPGMNAGAYLIDGLEANNRSLLLSPTVGSLAADNTFPRAEVAVPDDSGTSPLAITGSFTLEAWIRHTGDTTDAGNHEGIVGRYRQNQNGVARSYVLYYDSTAETVDGVGPGLGIAFSPDGNFVASNSVEFKGPITVGEWAHVAAVFEAGVRMELYVNGASIGQVDGVIGGPLYSGEGDMWIGQQFTGADEWSFQGNIDEVAIYNRALDDTEIASHFAAATDPTPIYFAWDQNASGDFNTAANWTLDTIPNTNQRTAIFGGAINSPRIVYNNAAVTLKGMRFASSNKYAVAGTGTITLSAASGNAQLELVQGAHELQAPVALGTNTDISGSGGSIDFNNALDVGTRTLAITSGRANINHSVVAGVGGNVTNAGTLGTAGSTTFGGNLTSTGTLDIDIGGTATDFFDAFQVSGTATLSGMLDVELINGFTLAGTEMFTVLTAGTLVNNGITLSGPAADMFQLMVMSDSLVLKASLGIDGDFNGDGNVNAADYVLWRKTGNPPNGYALWRTNFGNPPGAGSVAQGAVPEPGVLVLMCLATAGLFGLHRRRTLNCTLVAVGAMSLACASATNAIAGPYSDAVLADTPLVYYRLEEAQGSFIAANAGTGGAALDGFYNQFTEIGGPRSLAQNGPRPNDIVGGYLVDGLEAGNLGAHWGPAPANYTRVEVADTPALDISNTGLTLEAWVNRDAQTDAGANEGIIAKYANIATTFPNQRSYNLYYDPTPGVIGLALSTNGNNDTAFTLQTTTNIPQGEWTHVVATWEPLQAMRIYFNGVQVASRTDVSTKTAIFNGTAPLWIGHQFNTAVGSTFEGRIDEAAVYDRALSATEVLEHFQAATGTFVGTYVWNVNASGSWNATGNWNPASVPNTNQVTVSFGNIITSPQTVFTETDVTAKSVQFNNANKYAVAGTGRMILAANSGAASISVTQGNHEFQAPVRLESDTNVNVTAGSLTFNNVLDLNGNDLDIQSGTVNIRNIVIPGAGGMVTSAGTLAAAEASSIGGDFASTGVLEFGITGLGDHGSLTIGGTATLSGLVSPKFADGYVPAMGDTFTLLTAGSLVDQGIALTGPGSEMLRLFVGDNSLVLQSIPEPHGLMMLATIVGSAFVGWRRRK